MTQAASQGSRGAIPPRAQQVQGAGKLSTRHYLHRREGNAFNC